MSPYPPPLYPLPSTETIYSAIYFDSLRIYGYLCERDIAKGLCKGMDMKMQRYISQTTIILCLCLSTSWTKKHCVLAMQLGNGSFHQILLQHFVEHKRTAQGNRSWDFINIILHRPIFRNENFDQKVLKSARNFFQFFNIKFQIWRLQHLETLEELKVQ